MPIQIATAQADVELAAYARRCLLRWLRHRSDRVDRIVVELADAASRVPPRDSYCIVSVKLNGLPAATVVDVDADVHAAINRAADRVGRLVEEHLRQADSPQAPQTETLAA